MNVDETINVMAKLDTNGNLIDVYPTSGGDEIFVEAALDAVRRATPYPNETGDIQPVEVPVHFVGTGRWRKMKKNKYIISNKGDNYEIHYFIFFPYGKY